MTLNPTTRGAAAVVVGIGAGAFALSYEALYLAATQAGINAHLGYVYPLIVEGFVTIATLTAYLLREHGWRATAYPWTLAAVFFGFSLWANSAPDTLLAPVVRGVPSVALPFAVHLFTHMTKTRQVQPVVSAEPEPEPVPVQAKRTPRQKAKAKENFLAAAEAAPTERLRAFYLKKAEGLA